MDTNQFNNIQDPIARAEAMRAQAIADMVSDMITGVASLVKSAAAKLTAYIEYRRTFDVLAGMTDRELEDIGISRGDIPAVARGIDPRPQRTLVPGDALARRLALAEVFEEEKKAEVVGFRANDNRPAAAA
ncbi:RSP_7527 family protein [Pelagibius sp. 7325]|uniref:RSP_7527 family protein n=1 Tax=Pelagibius sp. 7325 TaxID=3131994 RepID=UPI0030ED44D7